jgi:hypothetical protein
MYVVIRQQIDVCSQQIDVCSYTRVDSLVLSCHTTVFFKSISYKTRFVPHVTPKLKLTKHHSGNPDADALGLQATSTKLILITYNLHQTFLALALAAL